MELTSSCEPSSEPAREASERGQAAFALHVDGALASGPTSAQAAARLAAGQGHVSLLREIPRLCGDLLALSKGAAR